MNSKLTPKQKAFADYYIETGNATEAARKAGYKGKNLNRIASENLSKVDIKQYIDQRLAKIEDKSYMNELIESNTDFIYKIIQGYNIDELKLVDQDDLFQEGCIGDVLQVLKIIQLLKLNRC